MSKPQAKALTRLKSFDYIAKEELSSDDDFADARSQASGSSFSSAQGAFSEASYYSARGYSSAASVRSGISTNTAARSVAAPSGEQSAAMEQAEAPEDKQMDEDTDSTGAMHDQLSSPRPGEDTALPTSEQNQVQSADAQPGDMEEDRASLEREHSALPDEDQPAMKKPKGAQAIQVTDLVITDPPADGTATRTQKRSASGKHLQVQDSSTTAAPAAPFSVLAQSVGVNLRVEEDGSLHLDLQPREGQQDSMFYFGNASSTPPSPPVETDVSGDNSLVASPSPVRDARFVSGDVIADIQITEPTPASAAEQGTPGFGSSAKEMKRSGSLKALMGKAMFWRSGSKKLSSGGKSTSEQDVKDLLLAGPSPAEAAAAYAATQTPVYTVAELSEVVPSAAAAAQLPEQPAVAPLAKDAATTMPAIPAAAAAAAATADGPTDVLAMAADTAATADVAPAVDKVPAADGTKQAAGIDAAAAAESAAAAEEPAVEGKPAVAANGSVAATAEAPVKPAADWHLVLPSIVSSVPAADSAAAKDATAAAGADQTPATEETSDVQSAAAADAAAPAAAVPLEDAAVEVVESAATAAAAAIPADIEHNATAFDTEVPPPQASDSPNMKRTAAVAVFAAAGVNGPATEAATSVAVEAPAAQQEQQPTGNAEQEGRAAAKRAYSTVANVVRKLVPGFRGAYSSNQSPLVLAAAQAAQVEAANGIHVSGDAAEQATGEHAADMVNDDQSTVEKNADLGALATVAAVTANGDAAAATAATAAAVDAAGSIIIAPEAAAAVPNGDVTKAVDVTESALTGNLAFEGLLEKAAERYGAPQTEATQQVAAAGAAEQEAAQSAASLAAPVATSADKAVDISKSLIYADATEVPAWSKLMSSAQAAKEHLVTAATADGSAAASQAAGQLHSAAEPVVAATAAAATHITAAIDTAKGTVANTMNSTISNAIDTVNSTISNANNAVSGFVSKGTDTVNTSIGSANNAVNSTVSSAAGLSQKTLEAAATVNGVGKSTATGALSAGIETINSDFSTAGHTSNSEYALATFAPSEVGLSALQEATQEAHAEDAQQSTATHNKDAAAAGPLGLGAVKQALVETGTAAAAAASATTAAASDAVAAAAEAATNGVDGIANKKVEVQVFQEGEAQFAASADAAEAKKGVESVSADATAAAAVAADDTTKTGAGQQAAAADEDKKASKVSTKDSRRGWSFCSCFSG